MNKDMGNIKPAKDWVKKAAVEFIAKKYNRSVNWGYMVARKDKAVQDGEHYKNALADYERKYTEIESVLS